MSESSWDRPDGLGSGLWQRHASVSMHEGAAIGSRQSLSSTLIASHGSLSLHAASPLPGRILSRFDRTSSLPLARKRRVARVAETFDTDHLSAASALDAGGTGESFDRVDATARTRVVPASRRASSHPSGTTAVRPIALRSSATAADRTTTVERDVSNAIVGSPSTMRIRRDGDDRTLAARDAGEPTVVGHGAEPFDLAPDRPVHPIDVRADRSRGASVALRDTSASTPIARALARLTRPIAQRPALSSAADRWMRVGGPIARATPFATPVTRSHMSGATLRLGMRLPAPIAGTPAASRAIGHEAPVMRRAAERSIGADPVVEARPVHAGASTTTQPAAIATAVPLDRPASRTTDDMSIVGTGVMRRAEGHVGDPTTFATVAPWGREPSSRHVARASSVDATGEREGGGTGDPAVGHANVATVDSAELANSTNMVDSPGMVASSGLADASDQGSTSDPIARAIARSSPRGASIARRRSHRAVHDEAAPLPLLFRARIGGGDASPLEMTAKAATIASVPTASTVMNIATAPMTATIPAMTTTTASAMDRPTVDDYRDASRPSGASTPFVETAVHRSVDPAATTTASAAAHTAVAPISFVDRSSSISAPTIDAVQDAPVSAAFSHASIASGARRHPPTIALARAVDRAVASLSTARLDERAAADGPRTPLIARSPLARARYASAVRRVETRSPVGGDASTAIPSTASPAIADRASSGHGSLVGSRSVGPSSPWVALRRSALPLAHGSIGTGDPSAEGVVDDGIDARPDAHAASNLERTPDVREPLETGDADGLRYGIDADTPTHASRATDTTAHGFPIARRALTPLRTQRGAFGFTSEPLVATLRLARDRASIDRRSSDATPLVAHRAVYAADHPFADLAPGIAAMPSSTAFERSPASRAHASSGLAMPVVRRSTTRDAVASVHDGDSSSMLASSRMGSPSSIDSSTIHLAPAVDAPSRSTTSAVPSSTATAQGAQAGTTPDLDELAEQTLKRLMRLLAIERERTGAARWPS